MPHKQRLVKLKRFLSTLSLRRATSVCSSMTERKTNFYPRSPCGERLHFAAIPATGKIFLSTLSLRRATPLLAVVSYLPVVFLSTLSLRRATSLRLPLPSCIGISIHALLAESDSKSAQNSGALFAHMKQIL